MGTVCKPEKCVLCRACVEICPRKCITEKKDGLHCYMEIDDARCVDCGLCRKVCINENKTLCFEPGQLLLGWSKDASFRKRSASGGVASTIYRYGLQHNASICGVKLCEDFKARYVVSDREEDIEDFLNSKYTFSDMAGCYDAVFQRLQKGGRVIFAGLPCHAAALVQFLKAKGCEQSGLVIVDIVCHGTPVPELLKEHIAYLETKYGFHAATCSFRDAAFGSKNYMFTLYDGTHSRPRYKNPVESEDCYQIGYHGAYIYRDCCYSCGFAKHERVGDLTLFDSAGLGKVERYSSEESDTSFILVNTGKGRELLKELEKQDELHCEPRPLQEAYLYNGLLNRPCRGVDSLERRTLASLMQAGKTFDEAAQAAFEKQIRNNKIKRFLKLREIKALVKHVVPKELIRRVQTVRKGQIR